jgi:glycosyltransferase involved in cell wall biosynthesis
VEFIVYSFLIRTGMTTFSVIIPTYNRRDHLMACLASVMAQRRRPDEVIVVDDGSTDGTRDALAAAEGITVIYQSNAGPGAARNRGAAAASGDYLVFLDSDDLWFPWSLGALAALVARHGEPALLFARFEDFSGDLEPAPEEPAEGLAFPTFLDSSAHSFFAGAGMMVIDRRVFHGAGGFAEDRLNAEDHDLVLRLGVERGFVQTLRPIILGHRIHAGNEMGDLSKTMLGVARLIERERSGIYPGGEARRDARRAVIARHARPTVLDAIRAGALRGAWRLYGDTLLWNARAGRVAFLLAGPVLMLRAMLSAKTKSWVRAAS